MLIKTALLLVLVSACAADLDPGEPTPTAEASQGLTCEHYHYSCLPRDIWANWSCTAACGGEAGHCQDYAGWEEDWCWRHPGQWLNPLKLCSASGDPAWRTWCVPGPTT